MRIGAEHVFARLDHRGSADVLRKGRVLFQTDDGHVVHGDPDSAGGIIHEARKPVFDLGHGAAHPGGGGHDNGNQHNETEHDRGDAHLFARHLIDNDGGLARFLRNGLIAGYLWHEASSIIQVTSCSKDMPTKAACSGTSEVGVMPGCVFVSRITSRSLLSS